MLCDAMLCGVVVCRHLFLQETGEIAKEFSVLSVEDLITKDIDELRQQAKEQRDKTHQQLRGETLH